MRRRLAGRVSSAPLAAALLAAGSALLAQSADPAATLVARAARDVEDSEQRFTGVVGEEHSAAPDERGRRRGTAACVSDILVVRIGKIWEDPELAIPVPTDMQETYRHSSDPEAGYLDVSSMYSNCCRFEVDGR